MRRRIEFEHGLKRALGPEYVPPETELPRLIALVLLFLVFAGLAWLAFLIPQ